MALLWENHEHHVKARSWFKGVSAFATCPVVQLGLRRCPLPPVARWLWAARWRRSDFPASVCRGSRPIPQRRDKGEIASLSGVQDDARYFQISLPVQPGNSGGVLVDERGNVIGIVSAKLDASAALAASGALPENVNYAVKSSFLLGFLESVPAISAKLKEPITADRKFEDVVKSAKDAAILVLVY
jgi:hypothetical protein